MTVGQFRAFVNDSKPPFETDAERDSDRYGRGGFMYEEGGLYWFKTANWKNPGFKQDDDEPVVLVSWNDAKAYCKWLNEKTKTKLPKRMTGAIANRSSVGIRMPRGDEDTVLFWGNSEHEGCELRCSLGLWQRREGRKRSLSRQDDPRGNVQAQQVWTFSTCTEMRGSGAKIHISRSMRN